MLVEMYAVRLLWGLMGRNYNQFQLDAKIEFNCHVIKDLIESISRHNSLAFFFSEHFVIFLSQFGIILFISYFYTNFEPTRLFCFSAKFVILKAI